MLFEAHEAEAQRCRPSDARDRRLRDEGIVAEVILAEGRQQDDRDDAELESGVRRAVRVVVQSGDRQRHGVAEPQVTPTRVFDPGRPPRCGPAGVRVAVAGGPCRQGRTSLRPSTSRPTRPAWRSDSRSANADAVAAEPSARGNTCSTRMRRSTRPVAPRLRNTAASSAPDRRGRAAAAAAARSRRQRRRRVRPVRWSRSARVRAIRER